MGFWVRELAVSVGFGGGATLRVRRDGPGRGLGVAWSRALAGGGVFGSEGDGWDDLLVGWLGEEGGRPPA